MRCAYPTCSITLDKNKVDDHLIRQHQINEFFCIFCGLQDDIATLKRHMANVHPDKLLHVASRRSIKAHDAKSDEPTYVYVGQAKSAESLTFWRYQSSGINRMQPALAAYKTHSRVFGANVDGPFEARKLPAIQFRHHLKTSVDYDAYKAACPPPSSVSQIEVGHSVDTNEARPFDNDPVPSTSAQAAERATPPRALATFTDEDIDEEKKEHERVNDDKKIHPNLLCKFCPKYIKNKTNDFSLYVQHMKSHVWRYYGCTKCDFYEIRKGDDRADVTATMETHFEDRHSKERIEFDYFDGEPGEMRAKTLSIRLTFKCDKCGHIAQTRGQCITHFRLSHPEWTCCASSIRTEEHVAPQLPKQAPQEFVNDCKILGRFKCVACNKFLPFKCGIEHMAHSDVKYAIYMVQRARDPSAILARPISHHCLVHHCLICSHMFSDKTKLMEHQSHRHPNVSLQYTISKLVQCVACKCVISAQNISSHYREAHPMAVDNATGTLNAVSLCGICAFSRLDKGRCKNAHIDMKVDNAALQKIVGDMEPERFSPNCCPTMYFANMRELFEHVCSHRVFGCDQARVDMMQLQCAHKIHFSDGLVLGSDIHANHTNGERLAKELLALIIERF